MNEKDAFRAGERGYCRQQREMPSRALVGVRSLILEKRNFSGGRNHAG